MEMTMLNCTYCRGLMFWDEDEWRCMTCGRGTWALAHALETQRATWWDGRVRKEQRGEWIR